MNPRRAVGAVALGVDPSNLFKQISVVGGAGSQAALAKRSIR
jgi:hypothetical protein